MRLGSTDVDALKDVVARAMQIIPQRMPGASAQPNPDPFAEANELRFTPNDVRLAEVGWNRQDLTRVILEMGQGVWLGEYFTGRERVDIYLKTTRFDTPEEMAGLPVSTPRGGVETLAQAGCVPGGRGMVRDDLWLEAVGDGPLEVTSITASAPGLTIGATALAVPPM